MTDHFATLNESRRPWIDPERLKEKFHRLTAAHHPDVAGAGARDFSALNAAYNVLREPHARLRHLIELEYPGALAASAQTPPEIAGFFMRMGKQRHELDVFLKKHAQAGNAVTRALLAPQRLGLHDDFSLLADDVREYQAALLNDLRDLDTDWENSRPTSAAQFSMLQQKLAYLHKWSAQIREALHQLDV